MTTSPHLAWRSTGALLAVLLAAGVGAAASGALLAAHAGGWSATGSDGVGLLSQLCRSTGPTPSQCAEVLGSRWAAVDFTWAGRRFVVPAAFLGLAYFVSVGLGVLLLGPARLRGHAALAWGLRALVALGLAVSLAFVAVMAFALARWCPLCCVAHAANAGLTLAVFALLRGAQPAASFEAFPTRLTVATAVAIAASGAGLWAYYAGSVEARHQWRKVAQLQQAWQTLQHDEQLVLHAFYDEPVSRAWHDVVSDGEPLSPTEHRPQVLVFTDPACHDCRCFAGRWRNALAPAWAPAGDVAHCVIARDSRAVLLARAYVAAGRQIDGPALDTFRQALYANADTPPDTVLATAARQAGVDLDQLRRDLDDPAIARTAEEQRSWATALGVDEVPAVFVDGRRVPELCLTSETFWRGLAREVEAGIYVSPGALMQLSSHADEPGSANPEVQP